MGASFGPYHLVESIGGGGLGEVFAARWADPADRPRAAPEEPLAVKRLHPGHTESAELRALFAAETAHSQRFCHPGLVRAFDHGEVDGIPYLAMPLVGDACLGNEELAPRALADVAQALAAALDHMHEAGYVHADVSPANVVLGPGLRPTLIDFSTTTAVGAAQTRPRGTYGYMSPEQVQGRPLGPLSDQFALATVLWEALARRRLFRRSAQHLTLVAVVEDEVPEVALPGGSPVAGALRRGLDKDPTRRFESCSALAEAIAAGLAAAR